VECGKWNTNPRHLLTAASGHREFDGFQCAADETANSTRFLDSVRPLAQRRCADNQRTATARAADKRVAHLLGDVSRAATQRDRLMRCPDASAEHGRVRRRKTVSNG